MAVENMPDKWVRVDIVSDPELLDTLVNFMMEIGAEGVSQEAPPPSFEDAEAVVAFESLTAYLPWEEKERCLASLQTYLEALAACFPDRAGSTFTVKEIASSDWGEEWKKYFHPLRIGGRFIIKPTWEDYAPAGDDIVIELDPGMAFGTGQHYTTAMCLGAMEEIFLPEGKGPRDVLDVGTGTGILGIAAARLGAARVVCLDIDAKAVAIARENALLNCVAEKLDISCNEIFHLEPSFQLILANLTAKPLLELYPHFLSLLAPAGYLIISGIIEKQVPDIEASFCRPPLLLQRRMEGEEWRCYVFRKDGLI